MTIQQRCRKLIGEMPVLGVPENHFQLWIEYNVRYEGLPRTTADVLLQLKKTIRFANYESIRRASRKVIHGF